MLVIPDPSTTVLDPFTKDVTLSLICNIVDPITKEEYSRDPRNIARKAETYLKSTGIGDTAYFGPEPEFFVLDDVRFDQNQHSGYYFIDSGEGAWNTGRDEAPNLGYKPRYKEGYFPVPPTDSHAGHSPGDGERHGEHRHRGREAASRGRHRRTGRDRRALLAAGEDGRHADVVQVHRQERRPPPRQDRDVHAQADFRRQRQRYAHASEHLEGRQAAVRRQRVRRHERAGDALHRRHPQARAGSRGVHQPDQQQLPPPGAGFRGAGQSRLLEPQPLRGHPHPDVLAEPEGKAHRGAFPRPGLQWLHGVCRHADGRARRHREPPLGRRSARQGHLLSDARGAEGRALDAGIARQGAGESAQRPRLPAQGRRLHRGRHRDVDRLQDGERGDRRFACARIRTSSRSTTTRKRSRASGGLEPGRPQRGPGSFFDPVRSATSRDTRAHGGKSPALASARRSQSPRAPNGPDAWITEGALLDSLSRRSKALPQYPRMAIRPQGPRNASPYFCPRVLRCPDPTTAGTSLARP